MPPPCRLIPRFIMMRAKPMAAETHHSESGFSLVEVAVALGIISTGIIGTLSMIGSNRALMENSWDLARMNLISDSVMVQVAAEFHSTGILTPTGDYDWANDAANLKLNLLFSDNGYKAEAATLSITAASAPVRYDVSLTVVSPSDRSLNRTRRFYRALNDLD